MDAGDLPPLRAGLGSAAPGTDQGLESTKRRLLATVTVMTSKAGLMAYQYCVHDSRDSVTHGDISRALKHQARTFLKTVDRPDIVQEIIEMETLMYGSSSDGSSGSEDSDSDDLDDTAQSAIKAEEIHALETRKIDPATGKCACNDCRDIRDAVDTWDRWRPEDEAEIYLKERVDIAIKATLSNDDGM